jgi:hypothetical protein
MTGPRHTETIDDVLGALREVVDDCIGTGSRIGYFAALYRQVALAVKRAIDDGVFDDGERMSRLEPPSPTATSRRCTPGARTGGRAGAGAPPTAPPTTTAPCSFSTSPWA